MARSVLLFGGGSDERMVSVASAQNLAAQYTFDELWFVLQDGQTCKMDKTDLLQHKNPFKEALVPKEKAFAKTLPDLLPKLSSVTVFMGFHGTQGEDGEIQAMLESKKVAFTASGSEASRMCFEKTAAKKVLSKWDVRMAAQMTMDTHADKNFGDKLQDFLASNKKIVIKPIANGSSIGLHIIADDKALQVAVDSLKKSKHPLFMAEKFIQGRELTVGVIEHGAGLMALPPSEVLVTAGGSFDYDGKYLGTNTQEITPAKLTSEETKQAQDMALLAHRSLGCYGYSRTDVILTGEGVYYLETNTLPGVTKASFIPQQLQVANISMPTFITEQMHLAEMRYAR